MNRTHHVRVLTYLVVFIVLCILAITTSVAIRLLNQRGEPANPNTIRHVSEKFLEAIHTGDIESAHSMLSEKFSPSITTSQFSELVMQDKEIFDTFVGMEMCEWGVFIEDGYVLDSTMLIYYGNNRRIMAQISLHKDSDNVWRIQGFRFKPDVDASPYGLCRR
jgi:hypothetical protein